MHLDRRIHALWGYKTQSCAMTHVQRCEISSFHIKQFSLMCYRNRAATELRNNINSSRDQTYAISFLPLSRDVIALSTVFLNCAEYRCP